MNLLSKRERGGVFEKEFTPEIDGLWVIYADWMGGSADDLSRKSQALQLIVEPRPSPLILFINAIPIIVIVLGVFLAIAFLTITRLKTKF